MENAVNHRMKPDKRSRSESNVDAIIAREPLLMDAYTLAANRTILATFDILIANVSLFANFSRSSCNHHKQILVLSNGECVNHQENIQVHNNINL